MVKISYNNKNYDLSDEIWSKYCEMHPVRTMEALLSTLKICYPKSEPAQTEIEKLVLQEYELYSNMELIVEKAREQYENPIR